MAKRSRHIGVHVWKPGPIWLGQECFVLGGGTSLDDFDFNVLRNELVIGCNDAYIHGPIICDICVFGDYKWYVKHKDDLRNYVKNGGIAVSCESKANTMRDNDSWLNKMEREVEGLSRTALGWNCNTGSSAMNLALILGSSKVYLLGFDMQLSGDGRSNWHANSLDRPKNNIYDRMMKGLDIAARQLPKLFPNQEVYNVNDYTKLTTFPVLSFEKFWQERSNKNGRLDETGR